MSCSDARGAVMPHLLAVLPGGRVRAAPGSCTPPPWGCYPKVRPPATLGRANRTPPFRRFFPFFPGQFSEATVIITTVINMVVLLGPALGDPERSSPRDVRGARRGGADELDE